jgi:hypothetical protein
MTTIPRRAHNLQETCEQFTRGKPGRFAAPAGRASIGMVSRAAWPQYGQMMVDSRVVPMTISTEP